MGAEEEKNIKQNISRSSCAIDNTRLNSVVYISKIVWGTCYGSNESFLYNLVTIVSKTFHFPGL